jgi:hypothetical protein
MTDLTSIGEQAGPVACNEAIFPGKWVFNRDYSIHVPIRHDRVIA